MKDIDNIQMYEFRESISKLKKSHQIREKAFVYNIYSNTTQYLLELKIATDIFNS